MPRATRTFRSSPPTSGSTATTSSSTARSRSRASRSRCMPPARSTARPRTSPATPASASRSRRSSTAPSSGSTGTPSCRRAARPCQTTSSSTWSSSSTAPSGGRETLMKIVAISGSLRRDSHNSALLRAAAELLPPGVELEIHDGLREIPNFDQDEVDNRPAAVVRLWDQVADADAVLISTPEYNHSIPGVLKNALDWLSRPLADSPLKGKPAAVVGASTGMFGAVWAQAETRKVLGAIGARVVDEELPVPTADEQFTDTGRLQDADLEAELVSVIEELVEAARARDARAVA